MLLAVVPGRRSPRRSRRSTARPPLEALPVSRTPPSMLAAEMRVDPLGARARRRPRRPGRPAGGGDLLDRVKALRRKIAIDLGIVIPPVRTRDNLDLPLRTYAIRLDGVEVGARRGASGHRARDRRRLGALPGRADAPSRSSGCARKWVPAELRSQAELTGATVVDRAVGDHHAPRRGRPHARRPPARPRGRRAAHRDRQAHPPRRRRGAHPGPAQPRRGAAGAAGAARRGRLDPRPGPHLRGAVAAGPGRPRTSTRSSRRPAPRSARRSSPRTRSTAPCT